MVMAAKLNKSRGRCMVGGSKSSPKSPTMAPREPSTENTDDPRGKFGRFLRDWLARHDDRKGDALASELGMKDSRSIRWWAQGKSGPQFADLDRVAEAMGYQNWAKLAAAVERFHEAHPPTA